MRFHAKHVFLPQTCFFFTPGIIKRGGEKPNIIPAYSELNYSVRTARVKGLPELKTKAEAWFRAAADATGCQVNCPAIVLSLFPFRVNIHYY